MSVLAGLAPVTAPNSLPIAYINPPSNTALPKIGAVGLTAIALPLLAVQAIGALGGNQWRDGLIAKITGNKSTNTSTAPSPNDLANLPDIPNGYEIQRNDGIWLLNGLRAFTAAEIQNIRFYANDDEARGAGLVNSSGQLIGYFKAVRPIGSGNPLQFGGLQVGTGFAPSEGLDFGTLGGNTEKKPITPPSFSPALGWGNGKPVTNGVGAAVGLGTDSRPSLKTAPPPLTAPPPPTTTPKPSETEEQKRKEEKKTEEEKRKEEQQKREEEKKKTPPPPPPPNPNINEIIQRLGEIGAISALINTNTKPDAQRLNSKNGACDALQSPSCTQNLKDDIRNPINQNIDATRAQTTAILANQGIQNAAISNLSGKVDGVSEKATNIFDRIGNLWNNTLIDKAVNYLTLITVIHNAAMLSRGIADTLGSAIDSGLQALGLSIKDKDGNQLGVSQVIGKSTENIIKSVIGTDNYTALSQTWAQANRIYQASINLISNVQNILDSTTAIAELTSNRVATLMNGLRNVGIVREDAYTSQTPNTTRFNAFMNKLENLEQSTSNVAAITGNIVSVQQSVAELKSNRTEFENAIKDKNADEQADKTKKREESIFKINDFSITRAEETES